MKNIKNIIYCLFIASVFLFGCDKNEDFEYKPHITTINDIDSIGLKYNHLMMLADGESELRMDISLHKFYMRENYLGETEKRSHILVESRMKPGDIKFFYQHEGSEPVEIGSNIYVADKSTDHDKVLLYADVLGKQSEKIEIKLKKTVIANELYTEKTIPVIFHIMESAEIKKTEFKIESAHILSKFTEINNAYRRLANKSPNGFDTKINFVPAQYSPDGAKLKNAGMNVVQIQSEYIEEEYKEMTDEKNLDFNDFIIRKNIIWDSNKYFNVWIVNSKDGLDLDFFPKHIITGHNELAGLDMLEVNASDELNAKPLEIGAVMEYGKFATTAFSKIAGTWLGLYDTGYEGRYAPIGDTDFCDDTFVYSISRNGNWESKEDVHSGFDYMSTNIMDKTSKNTTVTLEQGKRMLHVLNYCPTRMCWKAQEASGI